MSNLTPKPAGASRTTLAALTMPEHTNFYGTIHGRILIRLADECGALAAMRHVGSKMINTAALDSLMILSPVHIGERVEAHAEVSYVGQTSVETRIKVYAEPFNQAEPHLVAVGYALYVALDETGNPQPVPPLPQLTEADRRRDEDGRARQAARLARRQELTEESR